MEGLGLRVQGFAGFTKRGLGLLVGFLWWYTGYIAVLGIYEGL